jgi:hypothetical protein
MHEEAVDAAGGVDAQIAPTPPWKSRRRFPQAPTAVVDGVMEKIQRTTLALARG